MPVGSGTPPSWNFPGGGSGRVQNTLRAFEDHNWFSFTGQELTSPAFVHNDSAITVWFAYRNQGFAPNGPIFQCWSPAAGGGNPIRVFNAKMENDGTLSLYVGGSPDIFFANTGSGARPFSFQCNTWFYFQFNVKVDYVVVGSQNFLRATVDVILDNVLIISGAQGTSNFYVDTNFPGLDPSMAFVSWSQPNGSGPTGLAEPYVSTYLGIGTIGLPGNLWDIIIDAPGSGYGPLAPNIVVTTAHGVNTEAELGAIIDYDPMTMTGTGSVIRLFAQSSQYLGDGFDETDLPIVLTAVPFGTPNGSGFLGHATLVPSSFRRVNQAVVEPASAPINAFVRTPQIVIENSKHPLHTLIRASQLVIELPFTPVAQGGWVVKEC